MVKAPIIRLEIEALGESITAAFAAHAEDVSREVQQGVADAVRDFDFAACIRARARAVLEQAVQTALERHFGYGGKGQVVVDEALGRVLEHSDDKTSPSVSIAVKLRTAAMGVSGVTCVWVDDTIGDIDLLVDYRPSVDVQKLKRLVSAAVIAADPEGVNSAVSYRVDPREL